MRVLFERDNCYHFQSRSSIDLNIQYHDLARHYLVPYQVVFRAKSGCDLVVHEVHSALEEQGAGKQCVLGRIDARHAFKLVKCAKMLLVIVRHVRALAWLLHAIYGQPPFLHAGDCDFESLEGTRKGCVLSMPLFSLGIHYIVMDIVPSCQLRVNLWEADDGAFYGRTTDIAKAMEIIRAAEKATG
jgi:hypothetical protein